MLHSVPQVRGDAHTDVRPSLLLASSRTGPASAVGAAASAALGRKVPFCMQDQGAEERRAEPQD